MADQQELFAKLGDLASMSTALAQYLYEGDKLGGLSAGITYLLEVAHKNEGGCRRAASHVLAGVVKLPAAKEYCVQHETALQKIFEPSGIG